MASYVWDKNENLFIYGGINILSNNVISYDYFQNNFGKVIEYFALAKVELNLEGEPSDAEMIYSYYSERADKLTFSKEAVSKEGVLVTVPLILCLLANFKNQLRKHLDVLAPVNKYISDTHKDYLKRYYEDFSDICDDGFLHLTTHLKESFLFSNKDLSRDLKDMFSNSFQDAIATITSIKVVKKTPEDKEFYEEQFGIDYTEVEYNKELEYSHLRAYILFNFVFLDKTYVIIKTSDIIKIDNGFATGYILADMDALENFFQTGNSGIVMSFSLLPHAIKFIGDQKSFLSLKKDIQEIYSNLYGENKSLKDALLIASKHIEKQISNFPKAEFYIGTKNGNIEFIKDIVTVTDPKRFFEIATKVGKPDKVIEEGRSKTYHKKRKLHQL